jgi:hypothetical protein
MRTRKSARRTPMQKTPHPKSQDGRWTAPSRRCRYLDLIEPVPRSKAAAKTPVIGPSRQ